MVGRFQLKVCGLTRAADATAAAGAGADFLGFILHPASPRRVTLGQFRALQPFLPAVQKVAVLVEPDAAALQAAVAAGFDRFQIHFRTGTPISTIEQWCTAVGRDRLWLAPKLPPGEDPGAELIAAADTFLIDTFHRDKFGGTGLTGDWPKFRALQGANRGKTWILSGGLSAENLAQAVAASGATFVDVSSSLESAPGLKVREKIEELGNSLSVLA